MATTYLKVITGKNSHLFIKIEEGHIFLLNKGYDAKKRKLYISIFSNYLLSFVITLSNLLFKLLSRLRISNKNYKSEQIFFNQSGIFMNTKDNIELISAYISTSEGIKEKLLSKVLNKNKVVILKPIYKFNKSVLRSRIMAYLNKDYDYTSLSFLQPIKQMTGLWLGKKHKYASDPLQCQEHVSYVHYDGFKTRENCTIEDIFKNKNFKIIWSGYVEDCEIIIK